GGGIARLVRDGGLAPDAREGFRRHPTAGIAIDAAFVHVEISAGIAGEPAPGIGHGINVQLSRKSLVSRGPRENYVPGGSGGRNATSPAGRNHHGSGNEKEPT